MHKGNLIEEIIFLTNVAGIEITVSISVRCVQLIRFKRFIYIFERQSCRERETEKYSICGFIPQLVITGLELDQTFLGEGVQELESSSVAFPGTLTES